MLDCLEFGNWKYLKSLLPEVYMLANRILAATKKDQQAQKEMSNMHRADGYQAFLDYFGAEVESYIY